MKLRTHYDNLHVTRNAPPEVIKAAYKALAQKWHPDRNPHDPKATRILAIINAAYETLSDDSRRAAHDRWIDAQSGKDAPAHKPKAEPAQDARPPAGAQQAPRKPTLAELVGYGLGRITRFLVRLAARARTT